MTGVSLQSSVEKLASDLLQIAGQYEPPVNLFSLFPHRRILKAVPSKKLGTEGLLRVDREGFAIIYRPCHRVRERFTIAHEIGHTFFYNLQMSPPVRLSPSPFPLADEQRICDLIASELLMPRNSVLRVVERLESEGWRVSPPEMLMSLARTYSVSVPVVVRRLVQELSIWDALVVCAVWLPKRSGKKQADSQTWRAIWGYAPAKYKGQLFLPPFTELPRIRLEAVQQAFQHLLEHRQPHREPYLEPISKFSLGNLAKVLRSRTPQAETYPVYAACYARARLKLFDNIDVPQTTEDEKVHQLYQVLLCIPLGSLPPESPAILRNV
jgi:hypothetical protein